MANATSIPAPKRLCRSRTDKMIGGVCGGIAQYANTDPTLIRLIAVLLFLLGGNGLLIYIVLWIVMPEEGKVVTTSSAS